MKQIEKKCRFCGKIFITKSKIRNCFSSKCSHKYGAIITKKRDRCFKRIYTMNDRFLQIESNEKYYFLGLMASDGNLYPVTNTITFSQSGTEGLKLIEYLKEILSTNYNILKSKPKKGQMVYHLYMRSKLLWEDLNKNNIVPKKTYDFTIPNYILEDLTKLKYFLIGYIDGDGSIGVYNNMLVISFVCSFSMYKQLKELKLFKRARFCKKKSVMDIRFNGVKAVDFGDFLYSNIECFKSYKYKKFMEYKTKMFDISPKMKYHFRQQELFKAFDENPNLNCMKYAEEHKLNFQYVYENRNKWRELNGK